MDKMTENRDTSVSTGMFEAHNLTPVNDEVGVNNIVAQTMSFHNKEYLSGNVARFQIVDSNKLADAWFISVYNPTNNGKDDANNLQQVIVVHWYFFTTHMAIDEQQYPTLAEAIQAWDCGEVKTIAPQITPVK